MNEELRIVFLDSHTLVSGGDVSIEILSDLGNLTVFEDTQADQIITRCKDADVVIVNKVKLDNAILRNLPQLKYIVVAATGYDNIDIATASELKIPVSNVVGYSSASVAQHTFALLLGYLNRTEQYISETRKGSWSNQKHFSYRKHSTNELRAKTFGILGFGKIGQAVAKIALGFGMKVNAVHKHPERDALEGVGFVDIETLLSNSDILSLHAPLNAVTHHLINNVSLNLMKRNCILINTARGALINEDHLESALRSGRIKAALLDVLSQEPPPADHGLLHSPECYVTPHQAWGSYEARIELVKGIHDNILSFSRGRIQNQVV